MGAAGGSLVTLGHSRSAVSTAPPPHILAHRGLAFLASVSLSADGGQCGQGLSSVCPSSVDGNPERCLGDARPSAVPLPLSGDGRQADEL